MKLLFAASECAPFFKTGGLGDVVGALPKELADKGHDVRVVLPYFISKLDDTTKEQLEDVTDFIVEVGWRKQYCGIKKLVKDSVTYYFVDNTFHFDRSELYDYGDDGERFAFFQQAIIEMLEKIDFIPDILHVNDWQTAMIPVLLKDKYSWINALKDIKTVLTIHNILYQGVFDQYILSDFYNIGYAAFNEEGLKYGDKVSWLKGALYYSDLVTTVSPTYAKEIKTPEFGYGLDNDLRKIDHKLVGIINGIDYDAYNPEKDKTIPYNFSIKNLKGKMKNKKALQEKVGLPQEDVALIGVVTRLDEQKGVQLIVESMDELLKFRKVQLVLLGTGKPYFEKDLKRLSEKYPDKFQAIIHFDSNFAQWIYAGSDFFLMPSAFEPCGLSQLNSLRYGTLPIVHEVGGLVDTVDPYNEFQEQGTGFSFYDFDSITMLNTIDRALTVYYDKPESFKKIQARAMSINNSWEKSAQEYIEHYKYLIY
ncbi:MAG: glycogen synthase GlgA [Alkalibacterium gilvum]|uniref:Glycogen synthase n=1 Tax=Alkalibacterium gilvum TaxID=1130080 RepID=A0A1H6SEW1_9LACT|nr:glycogen synthase GlgA [Alkalibacterium gilvum]MDN6729426.1 glycogen synthase GlgA [Alkalibacterium sp.]SEI66441.1 starch synthase [Alkalibacterium gilvum]HAJ70292.1 glycogen synthase GlgA [Alkalibacterium sp.]